MDPISAVTTVKNGHNMFDYRPCLLNRTNTVDDGCSGEAGVVYHCHLGIKIPLDAVEHAVALGFGPNVEPGAWHR